MDIGDTEQLVLSKMIFPETFESLVQETGVPANVLGDILKQLLHYRYISPVVHAGETSDLYDVDNLPAFQYRLTRKGFDAVKGFS